MRILSSKLTKFEVFIKLLGTFRPSFETSSANLDYLQYDLLTYLILNNPIRMQTAHGLKLLLSVIITVALTTNPLLADEKSQKEKQLKTLQSKIEKLKKTIHVKQDSKSRYTAQLRKIEGKIGNVSVNIRATEKKIKQRKTELKKLRKTRNLHQQKLVNENDILAEQVYTAYTLGKQEKIKLLFSQQNAEHFQRNLVFYQYFSNARVNLINNVQQSISEILLPNPESAWPRRLWKKIANP